MTWGLEEEEIMDNQKMMKPLTELECEDVLVFMYI